MWFLILYFDSTLPHTNKDSQHSQDQPHKAIFNTIPLFYQHHSLKNQNPSFLQKFQKLNPPLYRGVDASRYEYAFCFLVSFFHQVKQKNLLNINKIMGFFSLFLIYFQFVFYNHSTKRIVCVYNISSSSDFMLLFYRVYFCIMLDLKRTKSKHKCVYFKVCIILVSS